MISKNSLHAAHADAVAFGKLVQYHARMAIMQKRLDRLLANPGFAVTI